MQKAHALIGAADIAQDIEGAVTGVVVDEHDFPRKSREAAIEARDQFADIVAFVKRRNDDGQAREPHAAVGTGSIVARDAGGYFGC